MATDTPDTHTAEGQEAQAEHDYLRSRELAGEGCWSYDRGRSRWYIYQNGSGRLEYSPTREVARALATERNLPPSPIATVVTDGRP